MDEDGRSAWARAVDKIVRGDPIDRFVRIGRTPRLLRSLGLGAGDIVMSAGKIARAYREHPEVSLSVWHELPTLLSDPRAAFPSSRRDGSIVVVTVAFDGDGHPVVAPILWDDSQHYNVVLSLYGREGTRRLNPAQWIDAQIQSAHADGLAAYERIGSADTEPKPDPVSLMKSETTSQSPGMIPADRPAKPRREILTMPSKVNPKRS